MMSCVSKELTKKYLKKGLRKSSHVTTFSKACNKTVHSPRSGFTVFATKMSEEEKIA